MVPCYEKLFLLKNVKKILPMCVHIVYETYFSVCPISLKFTFGAKYLFHFFCFNVFNKDLLCLLQNILILTQYIGAVV